MQQNDLEIGDESISKHTWRHSNEDKIEFSLFEVRLNGSGLFHSQEAHISWRNQKKIDRIWFGVIKKTSLWLFKMIQ